MGDYEGAARMLYGCLIVGGIGVGVLLTLIALKIAGY